VNQKAKPPAAHMREATSSDRGLFERFVRCLHGETAAATSDPMLAANAEWFVSNWLAWFDAQVGSDTAIVYFAEETEPLGFIAASLGPPLFGSETFPLVGIIGLCWVEEKARHKGLASRLIEEAEGWLRDKGLTYVETHFMAGGTGETEALWRKVGFTPYFVAARKSLGK